MNGRQRGRRREPTDLPGPECSSGSPRDSSNGGESTLNADRAGEPEPVLVSDQELEAIRWASYDAAMSDANAHRHQALETASARLDSTMHRAYQEYGQALEAAEAAFTAARRAAMNAHELAQAGQTLVPGYDSEPAGASR